MSGLTSSAGAAVPGCVKLFSSSGYQCSGLAVGPLLQV